MPPWWRACGPPAPSSSGKAHTTQFAYRDPAPTRNPWNHEHTPGGSSSGSAAAVAIRMVPCALGSQTVGSILRPAAYCGVVGLKGPHGLVPVDGIVPLGWSLDHIGPFARSVADTAVVLGVMAGREIVPASVSAPRLAVARQLFDRADAGLRQHLDAVVKRLAGAGAQVSEVTLPPEFAEIHAAGQVILESEAAAYHQNMFAKHGADYGPGFAAMMPIGLKRAAVEYVVANRARHAFRDAVIPLLEAHDALLSPTALGPAPAGLSWTGDASLCAPWSSAGVPSISIPTGLDPTGLPLALQLIQAPAGLERLLGVAAWCEGVVALRGQAGSVAMFDVKIDGGHGDRRHRARGQPHRHRHHATRRSSRSATSRARRRARSSTRPAAR